MTATSEHHRLHVGTGAIDMEMAGHRAGVTRFLQPLHVEARPEPVEIDPAEIALARILERHQRGIHRANRARRDVSIEERRVGKSRSAFDEGRRELADHVVVEGQHAFDMWHGYWLWQLTEIDPSRRSDERKSIGFVDGNRSGSDGEICSV